MFNRSSPAPTENAAPRKLLSAVLDAATAVLVALRDRATHYLDAGLVHAQPLVNHGRASGASIEAVAFVAGS